MSSHSAFGSFVALIVLVGVNAVDRGKFKTCAQNPFCVRNRDFTPVLDDSARGIAPESLQFTGSGITADIVKEGATPLQLEILVYKGGVSRFRITEKNPERKRFEVPQDVVKQNLEDGEYKIVSREANSLTIGLSEDSSLKLTYKPVSIALLDKAGAPVITTNARGLFNFEGPLEKKEGEDYQQTFGGHTDTTPFGPTSVGLDFQFNGFGHVYGIPEHATSLALKPTRGEGTQYTDPYRLFNLDVFEYELDNPMALYGAIPMMVAHKAGYTTGMYWANAAEMWVDVEKADDAGTGTHWYAESGIIDVYLFAGPTPFDVFRQYSLCTGTTALPPLFSLGYHQCRWNYKDQNDVAAVDAGFEEHNIPYDVLWLDIEHTDSKKYFTWHADLFPDPAKMQNELAKRSRKMVTIIDPHISRSSGYYVHDQATALDYYIKNKDGETYVGHCWPGSVSYLDFLNPKVREFWADKFALTEYKGSTLNLFTWNDMNEPSVFNGPETTMQKDSKQFGDVEHRDCHNMYGILQQMATAEGHVKRSGGTDRPFVLSRAFFAGTQQYGAIWTGDNAADWTHLAAATPMLLTLGITGLPFSGADVGGFFNNPDPELLVRWYQAGAFTPFFRGHAHIETKRREPWLFGPENTKMIRNAIRKRYQYLPLWYTLFHQASKDGAPMIRPMWVEFPASADLFALDDQFMVGSSLLVKPVTAAGQTSTEVVLPGEEAWYDAETHEEHAPGKLTMDTPLGKMPSFFRAGEVVPRRDRPRRNTQLMQKDPYTLIVTLNKAGTATGDLYTDDGKTYDFQKGQFLWRRLTMAAGKLVNAEHPQGAGGKFETAAAVERVVVLGLASAPKVVRAQVGGGAPVTLESNFNAAKKELIIRKPSVPIAGDWTISLE